MALGGSFENTWSVCRPGVRTLDAAEQLRLGKRFDYSSQRKLDIPSGDVLQQMNLIRRVEPSVLQHLLGLVRQKRCDTLQQRDEAGDYRLTRSDRPAKDNCHHRRTRAKLQDLLSNAAD